MNSRREAGGDDHGTRPARPLRVLLLTQYYAPEVGAPQTRLREVAAGLMERGHAVRVLTGPPHYPDGVVRPGYRWWGWTRDQIDGVPVHRVPTVPRPHGGLADRLIDQGSFALAAMAALSDVRWSDVVVVESPPLFLGATAAWYGLVARRPYLFHVADPWPDFPIAMGALSRPWQQRAAYALEDLAYRRAALITTVTPGLVELLEGKASAHDRVRLLPNGVDTRRFEPDRPRTDARRRLGWPIDGPTLVYAGSVGRAQGLGTVLEAAAPLAGAGLTIRIVGQGYEQAALEDEARRRGLGHIHFEAAVAADQIPDVLAAADGILVLLRAGPLYDHSLPTKLLEGLASGRPLLVSAGGEAAALVDAAGAGLVARAEDPAALRSIIERFMELGPAVRGEMGGAGRRLAETSYDRQAIVDRLISYLDEVVEAADRRRGQPARRSR